jgi:sigma-B regulation protein RsbU (phosphoserine phosphatase)
MLKKFRTKILSLILISALFPLCGLGVLSYGVSASMMKTSEELSVRLGTLAEEAGQLDDDSDLKDQILLIRQSAESEILYARKVGLGAIVAAAAVAIMLAAVLSASFAERISTPIKQLTADAKEIGGGDLDRFVDIKTGDELEELGNAFNAMLAELKINIGDVKQLKADRDSVMSELMIAKKLQASILPQFLTPFAENGSFQLVGSIEPSTEIGGDFYDYFYIDDHRLAVVSADVSSKGVSAALFMVITKTLINQCARLQKTPAEVFYEVNNILCDKNDTGMFVMAFMGILDTDTGSFDYVNAGHYPPLIKRNGESWEFLKTKPGFVLAAMENTHFDTGELKLQTGDALFLYTGVTEAFNRKFERYGRERFRGLLNGNKDKSIYELIKISRADVTDFICGTVQEDDITMLLLEYHNKNKEIKDETLPDVSL